MNNKIEEEFKPRIWLLIVLIIIALVITVVLVNKVITDRNTKREQNENGILNIFGNIFDKAGTSNTTTFNFTFESKSGTKWGSIVSTLLDDVVTNNKTNKERTISVVFGDVNTTDTAEIISLKGKLDDWTSYEVILDYDADGYVNKVTIMNVSTPEKFNMILKSISGTTLRDSMADKIDKILNSNRDNKEHIITVCYQGNCTNDDGEIRAIKKNFTKDIPTSDPNWYEKATKKYDIILDYDDQGYINKVTIEE